MTLAKNKFFNNFYIVNDFFFTSPSVYYLIIRVSSFVDDALVCVKCLVTIFYEKQLACFT